jgi:hypothetical protein
MIASIERHYRNSGLDIPEDVQYLIDQLKDTTDELDQLRDVLDEFKLSDNAILLRGELEDLQIEYLNLKDEYEALKYEMESQTK